jgi:hypothetical protein
MGPKFDNLILLDSGELEVKGPFETNGRVLDHVVIRFLIIDKSDKPVFGTATIPQGKLDFSECPPPGPSDTADRDRGITSGRFKEKVTPNPGLSLGDKVRAIGLSVAVKDAHHDPPAFETFTWCVTVEVVAEASPSTAEPQQSS